ncbi:hypothetical protein Tco_0242934 [Tanacetum coccineum]
MYPSHLVLIDPLKNIALKRQQYVGEFIVSEIRLDTPYGDKWIRRIGVNFLGVRDKIKSIKIITINHIKCVSLTDEQLCIRRIGCSGYAGSGIDHYANFVKKESRKKAFQDMLHGLGEVNPFHAYYNGSCTSKDNEDPSWSISSKTTITQKTSSALEVL